MSPPNPVIDQLVIQQAELSKLHSPGDFFAWQDTLAINWDDDRPCVRVCDGTGCRALGSQQVLQGLRQEIRKASIAGSTILSSIAISTLVLGRKSTIYSAPRYNSVCPFWRPNPLTSVAVSPLIPILDNSSRTSSSLNGLIIAVSNFIRLPSWPTTIIVINSGFDWYMHHCCAC